MNGSFNHCFIPKTESFMNETTQYSSEMHKSRSLWEGRGARRQGDA